MKIRKKMVLYFSSTTILLTGITALFIYSLFSGYRRNEFQQRLTDKIIFSLKFMDEVQQTSNNLLKHLDRITINDLYEEKMLLFDADKKLIFASLDDTKIENAEELLHRLSPKDKWIETREGNFDVIATAINLDGKEFYGIYKAYDTSGFQQLNYLKYILIGAFGFIASITLLLSFYLSKQISLPINRMAKEIGRLKLEKGNATINVPDTRDEIHYLAEKFNELMSRLEQAFAFQKHAIHHISHELKTPIAVLVSNFEKMEKEPDTTILKKQIRAQKEDTLTLSEIINALLEISKVETGNAPSMENIRIDELLFDIIAKLQSLSEHFKFRLAFEGSIDNESNLALRANPKLLMIAFTNLLENCIRYSDNNEAFLLIKPTENDILIEVKNTGSIIQLSERKFLFNYFFRGDNSKGKRGFGLGLVMVQKIVSLHHGKILYISPDDNTNIFRVSFPLS